MSLSTVLEFNKPEKMKTNNILLEIARKVVNSSPEPRYKIKIRDEVLAMKEKERLGFNFNRSVTASLKSRWDVVEKATKDYLQEIYDMNDQIEEDGRKYENQLINLIVTRTTNLGLNSRIEQMAGLFMHMNFYCTVLKFKIQHLEPARAFMFHCSDLMGFSRPSQLIDRYAALQHVFTELYSDYEDRQNLLNHLTETLSEVKAETNHRNMLMHNQMAEMHSRIKLLQTESAQLERAIIDQMESSTGASLEIYKIKNAVYNIYITMMTYRGLEATHSDSFGQLEELEVRVSHTQAAVKALQMEEAKRQSKKKLLKKTETETQYESDAFSDRSSEYGLDTRSVKSRKTILEGKVGFQENANASANESNSHKSGLCVSLARKMLNKSKELLPPLLDAGQISYRYVPLPPIVAKDSPVASIHKEQLQPASTLMLPKLDNSWDKTAKSQPNLKIKAESPGVPRKMGRLRMQETGASSTAASQVSSTSSRNVFGDMRGKRSDGASYRQSGVRDISVKNNEAPLPCVGPKVPGQSTIPKHSIEVCYEPQLEMVNTDINYDFTIIADDNSTPVFEQIDKNVDNSANALEERKSRIKSTAVQTRKPKRSCSTNSSLRSTNVSLRSTNASLRSTDVSLRSTNVSLRSNSLKDRNAKRIKILNEVASRRNLKDNCLDILANVKL